MCLACDDTDTLVLLIHWYCRVQLICNITMDSPIAGCCVTDLKTTPNRQSIIVDLLPGVDTLSGCESVSYTDGIEKIIPLKTMTNGKSLKPSSGSHKFGSCGDSNHLFFYGHLLWFKEWWECF